MTDPTVCLSVMCQATVVHQMRDPAVCPGTLSPSSPDRSFAFPANLVGLPAVTLNGGFSQEEGLPMGVQIMGPHWSDSRLLFFGAALEVALADDVLKERPESFKPACEALP